MSAREYRCVICERVVMPETAYGHYNNPWPVKPVHAGECCDVCDRDVVMPARIAMWKELPR